MTDVILRQNGAPWGTQRLGLGTLTIGRAGCLLTVLTMASNTLRGTTYTPDQVNQLCVKGGAFKDSLLLFEKAASLLDLYAPDSQRLRSKIGDPEISLKVRGTLAMRGVAVLHVDHDSILPGGDPEGDHFVLALRRVTVLTPSDGSAHFECADPAPGTIALIDEASCTGSSMWGKTKKTYKGVGVIPILKEKPVAA